MIFWWGFFIRFVPEIIKSLREMLISKSYPKSEMGHKKSPSGDRRAFLVW